MKYQTWSGRTAEIIALKGDKAKIRPAGESARWVKIDDLQEEGENDEKDN